MEVECDLRLNDSAQETQNTKESGSGMQEPEELARAAASYLYSYLEKSGAAGLFLSVEKDMDSIASAQTVFLMCQMIMEQFSGAGNVRSFLRRVNSYQDYEPKSAEELCGKVLFTALFKTGLEQEGDAKYLEAFMGRIGAQFNQANIAGFKGTMIDTVNQGIFS